jgi:hypothetical protein
VFEGDAASKVQANTDKMLASPPTELGKPGDEDDLESESDAAQNCPGGYTRIAGDLKPGVTLYCTKVGSVSYDVFAHVNGHWSGSRRRSARFIAARLLVATRSAARSGVPGPAAPSRYVPDALRRLRWSGHTAQRRAAGGSPEIGLTRRGFEENLGPG